MVYIFIHKEEQYLKSEKFEALALKDILVGYDKYIIYRVFIQKEDKIIWIKNLQIFEDTSEKVSIILSNFKRKSTFKSFLITNQKNNSLGGNNKATTNDFTTRQSGTPKSRSGHAFGPTAKVREGENSR